MTVTTDSQHVRLLSPQPWLVGTTKISLGMAADIVVELLHSFTWADHHWAGEAQASLGAIGPSFIIGVLSAIACTIYLLRKVNRGQ